MSNPLRTPEDYELFVYSLCEQFKSIRQSTVTLVRLGASLGRIAGELQIERLVSAGTHGKERSGGRHLFAQALSAETEAPSLPCEAALDTRSGVLGICIALSERDQES